MSATAGVSTEATPRTVEAVVLLPPPRIATRPKVGVDNEEKATVVEARQPNQSENEAKRMTNVYVVWEFFVKRKSRIRIESRRTQSAEVKV